MKFFFNLLDETNSMNLLKRSNLFLGARQKKFENLSGCHETPSSPIKCFSTFPTRVRCHINRTYAKTQVLHNLQFKFVLKNVCAKAYTFKNNRHFIAFVGVYYYVFKSLK